MAIPLASARNLWLYSTLSRVRGLNSYRLKILAVAFVGTHIPLLTLTGYALAVTGLPADVVLRVMLVTLLATLVGTGLTLWSLLHLLAPIVLTSRGLRSYLRDRVLPDLPTGFTDDAGVLMADTMYTLERLDDTLNKLRTHDPLTALPNRELFLESVGLRAARPDLAAVVKIDLSGFAQLNAAHGQATGDCVLREVGRRLVAGRAGEVVARVGSDQFAVLRAVPSSPNGAAAVDDLRAEVEHLLADLARPLTAGEVVTHVQAAAGITFLEPSADPAGLLNRAAGALAEAKQAGPGQVRFHNPASADRLRRRHELETALRGALGRGEFQVHYQPKVSAMTGRVTGAEALVRWRHPTQGSVSPGEFIPIAEETGLIVPIGEWVLTEACRQAARWAAGDVGPVVVSVNLSARQFRQPGLADTIARVLCETRLDPQLLEMEVTESMVMGDVVAAQTVLGQVRALGVSLALDDFGTGYSSLAYLKRFPFTVLKVDKSFVRDLPDGKDDLAITRSIIALAHSLKLEVVAEGVETEAQADFLRQNGCDTFQGFLFGRPQPAQTLSEHLQGVSLLPDVRTPELVAGSYESSTSPSCPPASLKAFSVQ